MQAEQDAGPLAGIRMVLLGAAIAGPTTGRFFSEYGADVIRVEWSGHVDSLRRSTPYLAGKPGPNSSYRFAQYNMGLRSLGLNLATGEGRALFLDLIRQADVFVCNQSAGVLPKLNLAADVLLECNPALVVVQMSIFGQGRFERHPGLGGGLSAFTGFDAVTGWPDGEPLLPQGAYTDFIVPPLAVVAILAALEEVSAGSGGRLIDVSEFECGSWFLMPEIIQAQLGVPPGRHGATGTDGHVSGVVPCGGREQWCVIVIERDDEWQALSSLMGRADLADEDRFSSRSRRLLHRDELLKLVSEWTSTHARPRLLALLNAHAVPAYPANEAPALQVDQYLCARSHWRVVDDPDLGAIYSERFPLSFSDISDRTAPPPHFGEHSYAILHDVLGCSDDRYAELVEQGVVE